MVINFSIHRKIDPRIVHVIKIISISKIFYHCEKLVHHIIPIV
jgi:hypothetical protein